MEDTKKFLELIIREMEIDDIPHVFHLAELKPCATFMALL